MYICIFLYVSVCPLHTDVESDTVSSLDTKGSLEGDSSHYDNPSNVLPARTITQCCLHQYNLSSSSDLDDEILPLFKRIQLQQKNPDLSNSDTVTHHMTTNKQPIQHLYGTLDFPIVID